MLAIGPGGHYYELIYFEDSGGGYPWSADMGRPNSLTGFGPAHLATIDTPEEGQFIKQFLAPSSNVNAWIGFNDEAREGEWTWAQSSNKIWQDPDEFANPVQTSYTAWANGQPTQGDHAYVASDGLWYTDRSVASFALFEREPLPAPSQPDTFLWPSVALASAQPWTDVGQLFGPFERQDGTPIETLGLTLEFSFDLTATIVNYSAAPISFKGYQITSQTSALNPTWWKSVADYVENGEAAVVQSWLGGGVSSFEETKASDGILAESGNGNVTLAPGDRVFLGAILTKDVETSDLSFAYTTSAGSTQQAAVSASGAGLSHYDLFDSADGRFGLSNGRLYTYGDLAPGTYRIGVGATSWFNGDAVARYLDVTVLPPNHAPTGIQLDPATVAENALAGTVVGMLTATDEDPDEAFTFSLVDSAGGRFRLSGNKIVVDHGEFLDYESATSHVIRVRATDRWGASVDKDLTILLRDLPEGDTLRQGPNGHWYKLVAQSLSWLDAQAAAAANASPEGFTMGHLATVSDAAESQFLADWSKAYQADAWLGFSDKDRYGEWRWIDGNPRVWQDPRLFDEPVQTAFVAWLEGQPTLPQLEVSSASRSVDAGPNQTRTSEELGNFDAEVREDYLIYFGAASQNTTIDARLSSPFFGAGSAGSYGGYRPSATFSVAFRTVAPLAISLQGGLGGIYNNLSSSFATASLLSSTNSSWPSWTWATPVSASQFDFRTVLPPGAYDLSAQAAGYSFIGSNGYAGWSFTFTIDQRSGTVLEGTSGQWRSAPVVSTLPYYFVEFDPPNHAPSDLRLDNAVLPENAAIGVAIGAFSAVDPDQGDAFLFELIDSASGRFRLSENQLVAAQSVDFESVGSYSVRIRATDQGGLSVERDFVIFVDNLNEPPSLSAPASLTVEAGQEILLAGIRADDPDLTGDAVATKPLRLALAADQGLLELQSFEGLDLLSGANNSTAMVVEGSLANLNAGLKTLHYRAPGDLQGSGEISLTLNDLGQQGRGGPLGATAEIRVSIVHAPVALNDVYSLGAGRTLRAESFVQTVLESGPTAYWRLDDDAGQTLVRDAVGGHHGTASPATAFGSPGALLHEPGRAVRIGGDSAARIVVDDAAAFQQPAAGFTIEAWIRPEATPLWQRIASTRQGPAMGWGFGLQGERLVFTTFGVKDYFLDGHPIPIGQWTHVAAVVDADFDVAFYIDGQLAGRVAGDSPLHPASGKLALGNNPDDGAQPWTGAFDEVAFYDRPLAAAELNQHFQAASANRTVLANDIGDDFALLNALLVAGPQHGTLEFFPDGSFRYRPEAGFIGIDEFTYRASNGLLQSAPATVRLEVFAIPGDADVDGDVDLADFGILKSHLGTGTTRAEGDFSGDGRVDLADFAILKLQFGTPYDEAVAELAAARWAASLSQPTVDNDKQPRV